VIFVHIILHFISLLFIYFLKCGGAVDVQEKYQEESAAVCVCVCVLEDL